MGNKFSKGDRAYAGRGHGGLFGIVDSTSKDGKTVHVNWNDDGTTTSHDADKLDKNAPKRG